MYKEHWAIENVSNGEIIYRFQTLPKFLFLIETSQLHFTRADKFNDKLEGSLPEENIIIRNQKNMDLPIKVREIFEKSEKYSNEMNKRFFFINSWISRKIPEYMWDKYSDKQYGIAIKSSIKKLKDSITEDVENAVYLGKTKYIDYRKDILSGKHHIEVFLHKDISFQPENEIRAIIQKYCLNVNGEKFILDPNYDKLPNISSVDYESNHYENGFNIRIKPEVLIEKIIISPNASQWYVDLIKNILKRYELNKPISSSRIEPYY